MSTVISVEHLSKAYQLGVIGTGTFKGDVQRWWAKIRGLPDPSLKIGEQDHGNHDGETVWALNDVSFAAQQGEVLGIIGRNGAGKSTLLKILSQVTAPTSGVVRAKGRIASLLEVGTGFHPDLTGRENIYLNGAILGMNRTEVNRKLDEIVDFSGVEKYIDTPVKRYSSGMHVRLGFAVAAHLDPEILLVDEVLAVGDIAFQKKCFDRMEKDGQTGKTIVVVSHNMTAITRLCQRVILMKSGGVDEDGPTMDVVAKYIASNLSFAGRRQWDDESSPGNDVVRLMSIRVCTEDGKTHETFDIRRPILVEFEYKVCQSDAVLNPSFFLLNDSGTIVFISGGMHDPKWVSRPRKTGLYKSRCVIPGNFLAEGALSIRALVHTILPDRAPIVHLDVKDALAFQVHDTLEGDSARGQHVGAYYGVVRPILHWETSLENISA
ncbi:MAG TPA: ABC transporter ATP-binding protein [Anaerolineales bacterium]|nr:ABC transporter ATP-binding protein [Anaerolineales bacterium]